MKELPIYFSADKTIYKGYLSPVFGAAGNTWHLMIDNYYCGRLRQYNGKWVFDATPKTASFSKLAEYFGNFVSW